MWISKEGEKKICEDDSRALLVYNTGEIVRINFHINFCLLTHEDMP